MSLVQFTPMLFPLDSFLGHLLYEMAFGFELSAAHPEPQQLVGHPFPAVVEVRAPAIFLKF